MKKVVLFFIALICTVNLLSQELKYSDLSLDVRPQGPFTSYVSKDGVVYKVGDTLQIGFPSSNKTFAFISQGDGVLIAPEQLNARFSGDKTEIKKIWIGGTKRSGFYALVRSKSQVGLTTYSIQLENAIATREIKSSVLTSDEALSELKRCKDKLDLGLISQERYDSIKTELSKFIK